MGGQRLAIGLMSGTSMDGVDVAAIETDGRTVSQFGPTLFRPYSDAERAAIRVALDEAPAITHRADRPAELVLAERVVTEAHIDAVKTFLEANGLGAQDVAVIGFHGQTVFHAPARGLTVQLGDGLALARAIGVPVVHDFRAADVAAGGEGAPLVPIYHAGLVARSGLERPVAVLNLGGVANLTFVGRGKGEGDLLAFDCGPGNALLDDWCRDRTGRPIDVDGRAAAEGRVAETVVADLLAHPFFARPAPKSLDRNAFSRDAVAGMSTADGAATLTAFTAAAVAKGLASLPERPRTLVVAGGGAHNPTMLAMIAARTGTPVVTASQIGWSTDFLEAQAFGHLAVRSLEGLPLSFPGTTGVREPMRGGVMARA
ncbi:MAG: anhydro-N-acetylmuramic acid kinase [Siculibacillus sp.]|nr:anhydro-N-acetylmuramic acid kinase [Siculibacillus sp.]